MGLNAVLFIGLCLFASEKSVALFKQVCLCINMYICIYLCKYPVAFINTTVYLNNFHDPNIRVLFKRRMCYNILVYLTL